MGKTITTHFLEGTPKGIQSIQISNKTIMGFVIPRAELKKALILEELDASPCLYLLLGESNDGNPQAYIGQTDDFLVRMLDHNKNKGFWEKALVFISQAGTLNKADILYLEHVALKLAKGNNNYCLEANRQTPKEPKLQRHIKDTLQDFFNDIQFITDFLNYSLFTEREIKNGIEYFHLEARGIKACGYYDEKGFTVMQGSAVAQDETVSFTAHTFRHTLIEKIIQKDNTSWIMTTDYTFNSPSTAAEFCLGSKSNGWLVWRNKQGHTLDTVYRKE